MNQEREKKKCRRFTANQLWNNSFVICNIAQRLHQFQLLRLNEWFSLEATKRSVHAFFMVAILKHHDYDRQFVFQAHTHTRIFRHNPKTRTHYLWLNSLANRLLYNSVAVILYLLHWAEYYFFSGLLLSDNSTYGFAEESVKNRKNIYIT